MLAHDPKHLCWPTSMYCVSEVLHLLGTPAGKPGTLCYVFRHHSGLYHSLLAVFASTKTASALSHLVFSQKKTKPKKWETQMIGLLVLCRVPAVLCSWQTWSLGASPICISEIFFALTF